MYTQGQIIEKFKAIHGDKYDYSNVVYKHLVDNVEIICPKHGSFQQSSHAHLKGQGCPKCGIESRTEKRSYTTEDFVKKAKEVHGDKYTYDHAEYRGSTEKVTITCPIHGDVEVRADGFLSGRGCPKCGVMTRKRKDGLTYKEFISRSKEIHNNKYNYSKVEYKNSRTKVCIICPEHGEFWQTPYHHINGHGCRKCADAENGKIHLKDTDSFITAARERHGNRYDYSLTEYTGCNKPVKIICPEHGVFYQKPMYHLSGNGCPECNPSYSKDEKEMSEYISSLIDIMENDRRILNGCEIDAYVPSKNIGFEFDGLYWHCEINKPNDYHINKTEKCAEKGVRLIHIFEDEWRNKKEICKSRIKNILGLTENRIFARKCEVREINGSDARKFLTTNHIQGYVMSKINIGLYYDGELVSLMTFGGLRRNLGNRDKDGFYEMLRFCNKTDTDVIGGASRLLKHFVRQYNPISIISYADRRWSCGGLYERIGFEKVGVSKPSYFYIIGNERKNRYNYRKDVLISKYGCKKEDTEHNFCLKQRWYRIYDCGTIKYEWRRK